MVLTLLQYYISEVYACELLRWLLLGLVHTSQQDRMRQNEMVRHPTSFCPVSHHVLLSCDISSGPSMWCGLNFTVAVFGRLGINCSGNTSFVLNVNTCWQMWSQQQWTRCVYTSCVDTPLTFSCVEFHQSCDAVNCWQSISVTARYLHTIIALYKEEPWLADSCNQLLPY